MSTPIHIGHHIGGKRVDDDARTAEVHDPARGVVTGRVALADAATVDRAVAAAHGAWPAWAATPPHVRARVLFRFRDLVERDLDRLAAVITAEHGKVLDDARGEVVRGLEVVEFACGAPSLLKGEYTGQVGRGVDAVSFRQPLGVVAAISPFNFPAMVPMWTFPVALACGNTVVLKPSEKDPSLALELADLLVEAGLPQGVLNVVNGDAEAVNRLLVHPDVEAVSFVGSTPVAEHVHRTASEAGKRVQALGGAKNHLVALPDADPAVVADAAIGAAYGSAGERCMAISVLVAVGEENADRLVSELRTRIDDLRIGPGDGEVDLGPLISAAHLDKVRGYLDTGVAEGAELVVDGRDSAPAGDGFFLGPCLLDRVTPEMRVYREEIFGPVLAVVRVDTAEEALRLVDTHEFGNGTAVFTRDGGAAQRFVTAVRAGMVGVNVPIPVPMAFHSFGGWKRSLFGDHHVHGPEGVRFFTRLKTATMRWPHSSQGAQLTFPSFS
ncbi:CoA-acylating methylmalonate-semialdehyde dehydrogenase [Pseudonocardia nematodicida]|uniref:methylmalonate-semialdehyde dehydrogenase (CoA acylating) n=1 Tax=Pseudonocardia nematodicida TaxID=1206997 RepID=A0ABV1K3C7_9PSEU